MSDSDNSDSYRDPERTTRMHNSPRHGPIALLKLAWRRYRDADTSQNGDKEEQ